MDPEKRNKRSFHGHFTPEWYHLRQSAPITRKGILKPMAVCSAIKPTGLGGTEKNEKGVVGSLLQSFTGRKHK